jgi:hypothetical protein
LKHDVGDDAVTENDQDRGTEDLCEDRRHEDWVKGPAALRLP